MSARLSKGMSRVSFGESFDETGKVLSHPDSPQIEDQKSFDDDEEEQRKRKLEAEMRKRKLAPTPSNLTTISSFEKAPAFGLVNFFTLRVLIFDIGVALGDVISDFAQVCPFFTFMTVY